MARIMIIHHSGGFGGGSMSLVDIADMLAAKHDISIYIPSKDCNNICEILKSRDISLVLNDTTLPMFSFCSGSSLLSAGFLKGLVAHRNKATWRRIIEKEKPDIVIVNSSVLSPMGGVIRSTGAKSILYNRETFKRGRFNIFSQYVRHLMNEKFDAVLFIANFEKQVARLNKPINLFMPDCLNEKIFREPLPREQACAVLGIKSDSFNVLFVGGAAKIKGTDVACKAMHYLRDYPQIRLVVVGNTSGPYLPPKGFKRIFYSLAKFQGILYARMCNKLIDKLEIDKLGWQNDMGLCYSAADIVIFPSRKPHQARPVFEAGYYRLPVIISDFFQTSENITNGKNGMTFRPGSPKNLAQKIGQIYKDKKLYAKLAKANYENALKNHSFDNQKTRLLELVDRLLSDSGQV